MIWIFPLLFFTWWDFCTMMNIIPDGAGNDKRTVRPYKNDAFKTSLFRTFNDEALFKIWQQYEYVPWEEKHGNNTLV